MSLQVAMSVLSKNSHWLNISLAMDESELVHTKINTMVPMPAGGRNHAFAGYCYLFLECGVSDVRHRL